MPTSPNNSHRTPEENKGLRRENEENQTGKKRGGRERGRATHTLTHIHVHARVHTHHNNFCKFANSNNSICVCSFINYNLNSDCLD